MDDAVWSAIEEYESKTGDIAPVLWLSHFETSRALELIRAAIESGEKLREPDMDEPDGPPVAVA